MYSKHIFLGYVGDEPVIRDSESGQFATFRLCTTKSWFDEDSGEWQEQDEWHGFIIARDDLASFAERVHKGTLLFVEADLSYREDEQNGVKRTFANFRVKTYRVARHPKDAGQAAPGADDRDEAAEAAE